MHVPRSRRWHPAALALAFTIAAPSFATAQGKFEASYGISVARIPIGAADATVDFSPANYRMAVNGRASGVMRIMASGHGSLATQGIRTETGLAPTQFVARTATDGDTLDVSLTLADGTVMELAASAPPPSPDRIALTDEHQRGIVDPLTALLLPLSGGVGPTACARTLPIFDGRRRFDLKLAFRRLETVKADRGYAGPAVVCVATFLPIAGHRPSSPIVRFLANDRDIEIVLAPLAGLSLLAPYRVTVAALLGNLTIQAGRFEMTAPNSAQVPAAAGQRS